MKKIILLTYLSLSVLIANAQNSSLKKFSFLLGNWEMKTKTGKITEHWKNDSKTYQGSSYKHNLKGDSTLTESVIIKQINGQWFYCVTGHEKGNTGTTNFRLVSTKKGIFTFEDRNHDFPQRVVYQPQGKDNLKAWIEGKANGKDLKIDFAYIRKN